MVGDPRKKSENNRAIQQLIDLLIGDDPTTDDLRTFTVPTEYEEKMHKRDTEELETIKNFNPNDSDK